MYGVHFALDKIGDVYLTGRLPLAAVTEDEIDRLLGCVLTYSDEAFDEALMIGFGSAIRREWAWREKRGESLANLRPFSRPPPGLRRPGRPGQPAVNGLNAGPDRGRNPRAPASDRRAHAPLRVLRAAHRREQRLRGGPAAQGGRPGAERPSMHVSLMNDLIQRRVWLAGIGMVIVAAVRQAAALATGPIALVQPIFIIELPVTLVLAMLANHNREALRRLPWIAIGTTTAALGVGLAVAAPSGATDTASNTIWVIALIVTAGFEAVLITLATGTSGEPRAALLGLAAACGYALTAALMKNAMADLSGGAVDFFTNWHIYAAAVAGVGALFLLQNALQAGSLVASQPMLTVGDALISIAFGVTLFNEELRGGWWLLPQIVALALIIVGCVQIAKSPLAADPRGLVSESAANGTVIV